MKSWSLNQKIWGVLCLLGFAYLVSGALSLSSIINTRDSLHEVTGVFVKRNRLASEVRNNHRLFNNSLLEALLATDHEAIEKAQKTHNGAREEVKKNLSAYHQIASPQGKILAEKFEKLFSDLDAIGEKMFELLNSGDKSRALAMLPNAIADRVEMREVIANIIAETDAKLSAAQAKADQDASNAIWLYTMVTAIGLFVSFIAAYFVLRSLNRSISEIVKALSSGALQVSSASAQIASASEELSKSATEEASSLEQTAASVEEMNSMIAKNNENAASTSSMSEKSQAAATKGKLVIQRMIDSMVAINRSSEGLMETVKVIEQIDKKTKVINEIVNKTELLSFNASVEAARAGEHGKGFAVVAEEVGNLARMSGAASEEIATLLEESLGKVNHMVAETKKNVEVGSAIAHECSTGFEDVLQNVNQVSRMASEIASASEEQAHGISEISKAMTQLDQITQQNAETSEECASAAEELSAQAESLQKTVDHLVLAIRGAKASANETAVEETTPKISNPIKAERSEPAQIVKLKAPRPKKTSDVVRPRKASGQTPVYNDEGFSDV